MNLIMHNLFELQSLEFDQAIQASTEGRIAELRAKIPQPILKHYDHLADRGKKGVAFLQHQTCGGCHVHVTLGTVLELRNGAEVRCCENCGRYLYLPEAEAAIGEPAGEKPASRSRRKQLAHAR